MDTEKLESLSDEELVERYVDIGMKQYQALEQDRIARYNKLFREAQRIKNVLKARLGDQRRLLIALYDHPNLQVRLMAAQATRWLEPDAARATLEKIKATRWQPYAADAGISLDVMDEKQAPE